MVIGAISSSENYCEGYQNPGSSGNTYIIGLSLGIGKTRIGLSHDGSQILDKINAFDKAEVQDTNLGQINMITVSSFCGINGLIWGYDLVPPDQLRIPHYTGINYVKKNNHTVPIYSAKPLLIATKKLFGTIKQKRFPLMPGSHVPCAGKHINETGPRHIYSAIAIGIPKSRSLSACLLMEDMGWMPVRQNAVSRKLSKRMIIENLAKSIIEVGENQHVEYKEIFADLADIHVSHGQLGCALVAVPYFTLAKKAIPGSPELLASIKLNRWEKQVTNSFLDKS
ncbi:MAG: histidine decarboxylase, pyruvoyl type [Candidatus Shapirobacteria bacterium]